MSAAAGSDPWPSRCCRAAALSALAACFASRAAASMAGVLQVPMEALAEVPMTRMSSRRLREMAVARAA
mgnify:CR=1 FL=1